MFSVVPEESNDRDVHVTGGEQCLKPVDEREGRTFPVIE